MKVRISRMHFPVTVLGPGRRLGLWFQGCQVRCPGCASRDTWESQAGYEVEISDILAWCRRMNVANCDGLTISGGEPFEQPRALRLLLDGVIAWRSTLTRTFDILCYSGFPYLRLRRDYGDILNRLDAIVPEPYVDKLPRGGVWRGSVNQPLIPLSLLGQYRYRRYLDSVPDQGGVLQISVEADQIVYIGIPDRGDMDRLDAAVRRRGVIFDSVSWRA